MDCGIATIAMVIPESGLGNDLVELMITLQSMERQVTAVLSLRYVIEEWVVGAVVSQKSGYIHWPGPR